MKVGMIGLGNMGMPMAERLLDKFGDLMVYNRTASKCAPLCEKGAVQAKSAGDLAAKCGVVVMSLAGPAAVSAVMKEVLSDGHEGLCVLDTSTISPELSREMAAAADEKNMHYIDCPVSGGPAGTARGTLSIMIGCEEEPFVSHGWKEVTDAFAKTYFFMKNPGMGSAIKLINNFMAFSAQVINGEALSMADALGISATDFYAVTTASSGNNMILKAKMNKVLSGDRKPGFATDLVVKDLELADDLCHDAKVPAIMLNNALQMYRLSQAKGYGSDDSSAVIGMIRQLRKKEN